MIGCGPVGLAVIAALKLKKAALPKMGPIIAADFSPMRRQLAVTMGADIVVDPGATSPYDSWRQHAALPPSGKVDLGLGGVPAFRQALIFECVGVPGMIQKVIEGAPRDARVVVVGVCMEADTQEPMLAIFKELNLQYVLGYTPAEFAHSLHLLGEGKVVGDALITGAVGLDGVKGAFTELANPESQTKIMVEPWR